MERRYKVRLRELLDDAVVAREQLQGMLARLGVTKGDGNHFRFITS